MVLRRRGPTGIRQNFDYYAGWAWHVYPVLQARIAGTPLSPTDAERLRAFVPQALELIGANGAPVLHGRSATYRFAVLAPLWAATLADVSPLEPGRTRDLGARVVSHFLDYGAAETGLLSIGWHRAFPAIRQLYTSGGSTYWAAKGLLGLLLPANHPEWLATPAVADLDPAARTASLRAPGWLVSRTDGDGIVRVLNHGSDGVRFAANPRADNPFYQRLGYSNVTSPELSRRAIADPLESHVALLDDRGVASHRGAIVRVHQGDRIAVSRSRVHWFDGPDSDAPADAAGAVTVRRGPVVTVASVVHGACELRLTWWSPIAPQEPLPAQDTDDAWPEDAGPWRIRIGGWALPFGAGDVRDVSEASTAGIARSDGVRSTVTDVRHLRENGVERRLGGTPLADASATPWAASPGPVGRGEVVAALVHLGTGDIPACDLVVRGDRVDVRWSDGAVDVVPTDGSTT